MNYKLYALVKKRIISPFEASYVSKYINSNMNKINIRNIDDKNFENTIYAFCQIVVSNILTIEDYAQFIEHLPLLHNKIEQFLNLHNGEFSNFIKSDVINSHQFRFVLLSIVKEYENEKPKI